MYGSQSTWACCYKFPLEASNLYLQWYFVEFNFFQVELCNQNLQMQKKRTHDFFIEFCPVFIRLHSLPSTIKF